MRKWPSEWPFHMSTSKSRKIKDTGENSNPKNPIKKSYDETQASHIFFFTLLVMLGNYEPTCIVTLKMVTM